MPDPDRVREALEGMGSALPSDADTFAFHDALQTLMAAARSWLEGTDTWFCNSALAPRCTEESRDEIARLFGGHESCQTVRIVSRRLVGGE